MSALYEGNSPVTVEFPIQGASDMENVSIRLRHHVFSHSRDTVKPGKLVKNILWDDIALLMHFAIVWLKYPITMFWDETWMKKNIKKTRERCENLTNVVSSCFDDDMVRKLTRYYKNE